jgi:hypothetical protein
MEPEDVWIRVYTAVAVVDLRKQSADGTCPPVRRGMQMADWNAEIRRGLPSDIVRLMWEAKAVVRPAKANVILSARLPSVWQEAKDLPSWDRFFVPEKRDSE